MSSEELEHSTERKLRAEDSRPFLEFLFADVARKPMEMRVREAAAVAKYLDALARQEVEPGQDRQVLEYLSRVVWRTALRTAPITLSAKHAAIDFLQSHAGTYLPEQAVDRAVKLLRERPVPSTPVNSPQLVSRGMSIQSESVSRLQDDLSERIYAAYWALRLSKVQSARKRVAETLNANGLERSSRGDRTCTWDSDTVYERVKQFETRSLGEARPSKKRRLELRKTGAAKWLTFYYDRIEDAEVYVLRKPTDTVPP